MNINMIIPPLKIQGKKTKIVPHIQKLTKQILKDNPNIDTWIEPFFGTGVVGFNVPEEIKTVIVSDINPYIIEFYENIKHGVITGSSIKEWLMLMGTKLALSDENGYAFYREMREEFNKTKDIKQTIHGDVNGDYYAEYPYNDYEIEDKFDDIFAMGMLKLNVLRDDFMTVRGIVDFIYNDRYVPSDNIRVIYVYNR